MTKIAGSGSASGSIRQRHGSADPDSDPDPQQNVIDPQHWKKTHADEHLGNEGLPPPLKGDDGDGGLGQLLLFPCRIRHCWVKAMLIVLKSKTQI